ncbi:hypothetical protein GGI35DRAFT_481021 [Trichoderma velutinum]
MVTCLFCRVLSGDAGVSAGVSLPNRPQIDPLAADLAADFVDSGGALLAPQPRPWRGTRGELSGRRSLGWAAMAGPHVRNMAMGYPVQPRHGFAGSASGSVVLVQTAGSSAADVPGRERDTSTACACS